MRQSGRGIDGWISMHVAGTTNPRKTTKWRRATLRAHKRLRKVLKATAREMHKVKLSRTRRVPTRVSRTSMNIEGSKTSGRCVNEIMKQREMNFTRKDEQLIPRSRDDSQQPSPSQRKVQWMTALCFRIISDRMPKSRSSQKIRFDHVPSTW